MAEECRESTSCVAISSSSPQLAQPNWWDLHAAAGAGAAGSQLSSWSNLGINPWQPQPPPQQPHQKYSNSSNNCDDVDQDVSISSTSFTNASNHSSLSVDSSRRLQVADQRSASPNNDMINGEQVSDNHIWNHVLLSVNGNNDLQHNDHDVGENFLDALSSKSLSTDHVMYEPACDYLKKLDNSTWEFTKYVSAASNNFNSFEKQLNGGFMENNNMNNNVNIENERLTKLSNMVNTWSIAPPEPQLVMDHDHHHYLKPQAFINNDSTSCDAQMGNNNITNRNSGSSLFPCYSSKIGLNNVNAVVADHHNGKYLYGNGSILPDSYSSCGATSAGARNFADYSKKQASSTRVSSGRGQGIANEGKKKRTDDTSSETVLKKPKQETSTVSSSVKMQAPKVKLGDRITALQQIVSPFGKTDTASVLYEAIQYIKFLQDQVHVLLSSPYLKTNSHKDPWATDRKDHKGDAKVDLKNKGLCLVPISCTPQVYRENTGSDYWTPTYRGCLYR
ncbi:transcription factor bHLH111 [Prunus yedoensis var. nudiflora]|uniref:Transcription factor bHLH111 n=1 Tax=Prunus yedoensis var. nudiflora TaxID=2094558 RepID=A0A314XS25_PRUYE|nr:transcription factor bHLH111 [Prunus yedoensis var. nudiflora]